MTRACLTAVLFAGLAGARAESVVLTFDQPETAGISGFRKWWDTPIPDSLVFDAVHRSLLVRFPGLAETLAAKINEGFVVDKVELVLPFDRTDRATYNGQPDSYRDRQSFGGTENYAKNNPNWHALAWVLRKPWTARKDIGPTFNAHINGAGYWAKYGAQDGDSDRFSVQFGPAEVSVHKPEGRMDVTDALLVPEFGASLADRLRGLDERGFLLRKWEVYDFRFRKPGDGAYEWQVATGGFGLHIKRPKLVVTLTPGKGSVGKLPPPLDIDSFTAALRQSGKGGQPTSVMPTPAELDTILGRYAMRRPDWMPDWQWQRVRELQNMGGGTAIPAQPEAFGKWIDELLAVPPRQWNGFDQPDRLQIYYLFRDALPAYVQDHAFRDYWTAWLMPDRTTDLFEHPQAIELWHGNQNKYYLETGDWRGNASSYRAGYTRVISTMNFNYFASLGALLGGNIIGSEYAMADGRHGLEYLPLRLWAWLDGTTQESIDHYYLPVTLNCQKMFADFGPTTLDRLMGKSCLAKTIDELTGAYHPSLRRFISTSGRTSVPQFLLVSQEGLQHVVHTMSRSGALTDLGNKDTPAGFPVISANNMAPGRVAWATVTEPWAPEWMANVVDGKPIPFESTSTEKEFGNRAESPLWKRSYLGRHYGLAGGDLHFGCVPIMAQWRRLDRQAETARELGTLLLRCGFNNTIFANEHSGWVATQGNQATLQHRNKMLTLTSPYSPAKPLWASEAKGGVRSSQSSIAIYNYEQPSPSWEIFVDGKRINELPHNCRQGQRITIKDGVTYIGIIPLPSSNLGRTNEVVLREGEEQTQYPQFKVKAALVIDSFMMQRDSAKNELSAAEAKAIDLAYGGFAVEFGDVAEHGDFDAFQKHFNAASVDVRWDADQTAVHGVYKSGEDVLEMACRTDYVKDMQSDKCFVYRRVNGEWPYLPKGIERETNVSIMGTVGRLEKGGAVLTSEPGVMAYLQAEPASGTFVGWNPLPDPVCWRLEIPGGISVKADGRLGLARVEAQPGNNTISIDYAVKDDQNTDDMASSLLVFGMKEAPSIALNGKPLAEKLRCVNLEEGQAWVIPLREDAGGLSEEAIAKRFRMAEQLFDLLTGKTQDILFARDWLVAGPFSNDFLSRGFDVEYPPEKSPAAPDMDAVFKSTVTENGNLVEMDVRWTRLLDAGHPTMAPDPVNLLDVMKPNRLVTAYLFTKIHSDRAREVVMFTGSDQNIAVWVNGEQALRRKIYRAALRDQDKTPIKLKEGENAVLVKLAHGHEARRFYFRIGDIHGFPITDGICHGFDLDNPDNGKD